MYSETLCSSCCKVNLPILYKTGVNVNDFTKIIDLQTGQEYGTNEDEETESNVHQLEPFASSTVEIGHILEQQQMQINTLNLEVEALTTQVSELRENQQVLNEMKRISNEFIFILSSGKFEQSSRNLSSVFL